MRRSNLRRTEASHPALERLSEKIFRRVEAGTGRFQRTAENEDSRSAPGEKFFR
jgi:hypothetical protein